MNDNLNEIDGKKKKKKDWPEARVERATSRTQSENHTTRPSGRLVCDKSIIMAFDASSQKPGL